MIMQYETEGICDEIVYSTGWLKLLGPQTTLLVVPDLTNSETDTDHDTM
jgi:hypothetical protein